MGLKIVALRKAFDAMRTFVGPFAGMDSGVNKKIVGALEAFATNGTQMGLFAGVIAFVDR